MRKWFGTLIIRIIGLLKIQNLVCTDINFWKLIKKYNFIFT